MMTSGRKHAIRLAAGMVLTGCLLVIGTGSAQAKTSCAQMMQDGDHFATNTGYDLLYGNVNDFWFDAGAYIHNQQKMMAHDC